jgi:transposase
MVAWGPRHLTAAQSEERRMAAVQLFRTGRFSDTQIARQLGITRGAVGKWHAARHYGGAARLAARPKTGRTYGLT